jgi:predicted nucleic acid-binding protein
MIVLDASVTVEYLLQSVMGAQVLARLRDPHDIIHIPHIMPLEVCQVFRRMVQAGVTPHERAREALADLGDLAAVRHSHEPLLPRIWELRDNLTAYDAAYVALAETLDAPLLTLDAKLASALGHEAQIELME